MHSEHDTFIPADHSRELFNASRAGQAEIWLVSGAKHSEILNVFGDEYRQRIRAFVRKFVHERDLPAAPAPQTETAKEATAATTNTAGPAATVATAASGSTDKAATVAAARAVGAAASFA